MKYLKTYEYTRPSYYFDLVKFYNGFRNHFNELKNIEDKKNIPQSQKYSSGEFFLLLNIIPDWKKLPLEKIIEKVIEKILIDKEVEFTEDHTFLNLEHSGRVKSVLFHPYVFSGNKVVSFNFKIKIYGMYNISSQDYINVDYYKPFKIYGEPSKIEKYIEMISDTNKYNL